MNDDELEAEFNKLILGVGGGLPEASQITLTEISKAIMRLSEATMWLSDFLMLAVQDESLDFPEELSATVIAVEELATQITSELSEYLECDCDDCTEAEDDDE